MISVSRMLWACIICRATLLAASLTVQDKANCTTQELGGVSLEIGLVQTISHMDDTELKWVGWRFLRVHFREFLRDTLLALTNRLFEATMHDTKIGVGGFQSYSPNGKGDRDFCYHWYSGLESKKEVVIHNIEKMTNDNFFPQGNKDPVHDSSLTAAMMALGDMNFSPASQKNTLRILLIQSDRIPSIATGDGHFPYKGDGTDTCDNDPPSYQQVSEILKEHNAYLSVVAKKSSKKEWDKVCKAVGRCAVAGVDNLYKTDKDVFMSVITETYCKWRDAPTEAPTTSKPSTKSAETKSTAWTEVPTTTKATPSTTTTKATPSTTTTKATPSTTTAKATPSTTTTRTATRKFVTMPSSAATTITRDQTTKFDRHRHIYTLVRIHRNATLPSASPAMALLLSSAISIFVNKLC